MTELDPRWRDAVRRHAETTPPTPDAWAAITERASEAADAIDDDPRAGGGTGARRWLGAVAAAVLVAAGVATAVVVTRDDDPGRVRAGPPPTTTATTGTEPDPTDGPAATELPPPPGSVLVTGRAMVAESPGHGPGLCAGSTVALGPPVCDEVAVDGWSWDSVEGEIVEGDARYGFFRVAGYFDGERLVLVDPPASAPGAPAEDDPAEDFGPPCDPPPGGWAVTDPARVGFADMQAMVAAARAHPDVGEVWIDQSAPVQGGILTASFTGELEGRRAELAALWGGALCVTTAPIAQAELRTAQTRLHEDPPIEVGGIPLRVTGSAPDGRVGVLEIDVLVAPEGTDDTEEELEAVLGVPVDLTAALTPVT